MVGVSDTLNEYTDVSHRFYEPKRHIPPAEYCSVPSNIRDLAHVSNLCGGRAIVAQRLAPRRGGPSFVYVSCVK